MRPTEILLVSLALVGFAAAAINVHTLRLPDGVRAGATENSNIYIVEDGTNGFLVDLGKYEEQANQTIAAWKAKFPTKNPKFAWITHGHPDHWGGLAWISRAFPGMPFFVGTQSDMDEMVFWIGFLTSINALAPLQLASSTSYSTLVSVYAKQVPLSIFGENSVMAVGGFLPAESKHASMLHIPSINALFVGDVINVRSHLFLTIFDATNTYMSYPNNDEQLCQWIGIMNGLACSFPANTIIYPGHGKTNAQLGVDFQTIVMENREWMMYTRSVLPNQCNATTAWNQIIARFPTYEMKSYLGLGGVAGHVPVTANGHGCNCTAVLAGTATCSGNTPRYCPFEAATLSSASCAAMVANAANANSAVAAGSAAQSTADDVETIKKLSTAIIVVVSVTLVFIIVLLIIRLVAKGASDTTTLKL